MERGTGVLAIAEHFLEIERPERALQSLDKASGDDLQEPDYWFLRTQALYDLDRYREALETSQRGLALDPQHIPLLYLACCCFDELGNPAKAEKAILAAARLDPDDPSIICRYAHLVAKAGQLDKAGRLVEHAGRIDPGSEPVLRTRVLLAYLRGNDKEFGHQSRELLAEHPGDIYGHLMLGVSGLVRGQTKTAARHFGDAAREDPTDSDIVEMAREGNFVSHPLLWPLWPAARLGSRVLWLIVIALVVTMRAIGCDMPAACLVGLYLLLVIYSWTVPPLLRWWLRRRSI